MEDLVLGLMLRQQGSTTQQPSRAGAVQQGASGQREGSDREGMTRQGSYTEVQLGTPMPTDTVSVG